MDNISPREFISLNASAGQMRCYVAEPPVVDEATAGVVLLMHLWGIDKDQRRAARRFAQAGFVTIVPDLYARTDAPDGDEEHDPARFIPFARGLTTESIDADIAAAVHWLTERHPKIKLAVAGFCMGGKMALQRSRGYGELFRAAAIWYGALPAFNPEDVDLPIVASFGADDHAIPVDGIEQFARRLNVPNDVRIYPGAGHAFADTTRDTYRAEPAEDSWARTLAFLQTQL